jgi:hypothetical protein
MDGYWVFEIVLGHIKLERRLFEILKLKIAE